MPKLIFDICGVHCGNYTNIGVLVDAVGFKPAMPLAEVCRDSWAGLKRIMPEN